MASGPPIWFRQIWVPGKVLGEGGQVGDLRMIQPRVERHVQRGEAGEAFAERVVVHQFGWGRVGGVHQAGVSIVGGDVADAAEPAAAGADMGFQDLGGFFAEAEVDVADDAGADLGGAVAAGGAHGGDAVDEFGFADGFEGLRPGGAVHRAALQEDGGDDVVAAVGVGQQVVEHVDPVGPFPQMVVRIDDRQAGFEDGLGAAGEPVVTDRYVGAGGRGGGAHGGVSCCWVGYCFPGFGSCQEVGVRRWDLGTVAMGLSVGGRLGFYFGRRQRAWFCFLLL